MFSLLQSKYLLLLPWLLIVLGAGAAPQGTKPSNSWNGIIPLYSTRHDVERLLGSPQNAKDCTYCIYRNDTVHVLYAEDYCKGQIAGWDKPQDTVITFIVYDTDHKLVENLKKEQPTLIETADDTRIVYYTDLQNGRQYLVSPEGYVKGTKFFPLQQDSYLRCKGFPPYDQITTTYTLFDSFPVTDGYANDFVRVDSFFLTLQEMPQYRGYIFIYGDSKTRSAQLEKYVAKLKNYLGEKLLKSNISVFPGGCRRKGRVEIFLLPDTYPSPNPTPSELCDPKVSRVRQQ